jgi:hypothetical protein
MKADRLDTVPRLRAEILDCPSVDAKMNPQILYTLTCSLRSRAIKFDRKEDTKRRVW